MKRIISLAIACLFFVALPTQAATTHERTIDTQTAHPAHSFLKFDTALEAFDFNGDGRMEIVGHNENRHVYVFDLDGNIRADLNTQYPSGWGARPINPPEVAIMEHNGAAHVVVANSAASIAVFRHDGDLSFTKTWERRMTECHPSPGMDAQPVVHDLDGDGDLEILVQTEEVGVYALRLDGSTMWKQCIGGGNGEPAVADMDFDGVPDVVFASDDGTVTRIHGAGGWTIWSYWAGNAGDLGVASMPVGPTIGQIDGVGPLDVAVGARDSSNSSDPHQNRAALFAINGNGQLLWMRQHAQGTPLTYTHPIIHDVDGDGEADILWADWNTVGHKPPHCDPRTDPNCDSTAHPWQLSGTPAIYRYDSTGDLRYRKAIGSFWNNNDLALADVDGDGVQELIVDDGTKMIYVDSRTGVTEASIGLNGWVPTRGATVYDLWGDGTMGWILPVHKGDAGGVMIFDTNKPYSSAWPHVPNGKASAGAPPPSGTFSAHFQVPDTTNNWWVETSVTSGSPITSVSAVVNGASTSLSKQSWGAWARSFHVDDGAQVVFKARNAAGAEASSKTYVWGDGSAPPPSGDFAATFTVADTKNNWWVETGVTANQPVASMHVKVNGGAPQALSATEWGTWAKSFYVANGASVVFTATSTTGATASSSPYTWGQSSPPSGDFAVTWTVPSSVNQWWVEVNPKANHPLTGVTASINGGAATQLGATDWGTWAKSMHAPTGSQVVFKATDGHGHTASHTVTWLDDGKAFAPTFAAKSVGNDWWVEVDVHANKPVEKVDARINGGPWQPLSRTEWGSWAKGLHAPDGAAVQFRASHGGTTVQSQTVTWT